MRDIIIRGERCQFIPHDGFSKTLPMLERFAECLTEHGVMCRAAAECGIGMAEARSLRTKLRVLGYGL